MTVRPLVLYPSPWLRARCQAVDLSDPDLVSVVDDLRDTLAAHPGIGIAAPQIGVLKQVFLIDGRRFRNDPGFTEWVAVNPRIVAHSGKQISREGCLSIPGFLGDTRRARRVSLEWTDLDGVIRQRDLRGFAAVAAQHEFDHLHGVLFLDRLVPKREALRLRAQRSGPST